MAKLNFTALLKSGSGGTTKVSGPTVCVTQKVLDQMAKHEGNAGLRQAVIIVRNPGEALPKADGLLDVTVDGDTYRLNRQGKEFNIRVTSQTEATMEAFGKLFNKLSGTPNQAYAVTFKAA